MVNSGPNSASHAGDQAERQDVQNSRKDPIPSQVWQERRKLLPRLHLRAQNIINLVLGGLEFTDKDDLLIPEDVESWLTEIRFDGEENSYLDNVELIRTYLMQDVMEKFTRHKYIRIQEYEENVGVFAENDFPVEKVYKILYLANLSILLVEVIEMTSKWEEMSPEQRGLAISEIDLVFPTPFVYPGELGATDTMQIVSELRTQIFIQTYLEMKDTEELDEWNSPEKVVNIFKLDEDHDTVRPEERKLRNTYSQFARSRLQKEAAVGVDPKKVVNNFNIKYSWNQLLKYLLPWIYEKCFSLLTYLSENQSSRDLKGKKIISIKPTASTKPAAKKPRSSQLNSDSDSGSDSDSDSEDDEEAFDVRGIAQIIAQNRSPKKSGIQTKQPSEPPLSPQPRKHSHHKSKPVSKPTAVEREDSPLFIPSGSEDEPQPELSPAINDREDSPFKVFQQFTGASQEISRSRRVPKETQRRLATESMSPVENQPRRPRQLTTTKRSIFDEQPDARRISFDSQSHKSRSPPPQPRKRHRPTPSDDDDEDFVTYDRPVDRDRLEHSRTSAAARRPDLTEMVLDRIHGPVQNSPNHDCVKDEAHEGMSVRKGRGFEWTKEQEMFLIEQIETYGPAWSDIARTYCRPGMILEGRDQTKLKDKARNIKEKYIREGRKLPRNFINVTPQGTFEVAKERMMAQKKY